MLSSPYVIVDIETTGTRPQRDRIIEIAVLRVENNMIVDSFTTLINPECSIPPSITQLTGITNADVADAPTFEEVALTLYEYLDGAVFVAHNVQFDYGFIVQEFARTQLSFSARRLCTVRLSRALYPRFRRHNLDAIIQRFDINALPRHRAEGDTHAVWYFLKHVQQEFTTEHLTAVVKKVLKQPSLPARLHAPSIHKLPNTPGVYLFYAAQRTPLYVGKSVHIRDRVYSHFADSIRSSTEMRIAQEIDSVEAIETAGELSALLLESRLIKELYPLHNRQKRRVKRLTVLLREKDAAGYATVRSQEVQGIDGDQLSHVVGVFRSKKQAENAVQQMADEYELCLRLLGQEKMSRACFRYQLGTCRGACVGQEDTTEYNERFEQAVAARKIMEWPFDSPRVFIEQQPGRQALVFVDQWMVLGAVQSTETGYERLLPEERGFDYDTYAILRQYVIAHRSAVQVQPTTHEEIESVLDESTLLRVE